jgi:hypothetical protein
MTNIEGSLSHTATRKEIKQLHQQGITVDDDNTPVPENAQVPAHWEGPPPGIWEKPQHCAIMQTLTSPIKQASLSINGGDDPFGEWIADCIRASWLEPNNGQTAHTKLSTVDKQQPLLNNLIRC